MESHCLLYDDSFFSTFNMSLKRLTETEFTVGWICALSVELSAAEAMLDEEYEELPQSPPDTNLYSLGRIGAHNVVISCLPAGQLGTHSAAAVASQMKSKFTSIRFSVMVGIGGGVPGPEEDIRLGDVVISTPSNQHGGVIQYDFGKTGREGGFQRTGSLDAPPVILLNAINRLQSNQRKRRIKVQEYLSSFDSLSDFAYEGADRDILFQPTYPHSEGTSCEGCSKEELVIRPRRETSQPLIFFGTIASGNQVMKDAITRDRLSKELGGILCFEMEAAGLMNIFPCLVIRGICDYADSHKNKRWQPYAAATAAACAKEILSIIPPIEVINAQATNEVPQSGPGQTSFSLFLYTAS
jgi:nucleoside phosphorylase